MALYACVVRAFKSAQRPPFSPDSPTRESRLPDPKLANPESRFPNPESNTRQLLPEHEMIEPHVRELFLDRILPQPRREIRKIDAVHLLILVEAGKDDRLGSGLRIDVFLQAL